MTLHELNLIKSMVVIADLAIRAKTPDDPELCAAADVALIIIEREIKLKTMNPVTGEKYD